VHRIEAAADPDGTFAISEDAALFPGGGDDRYSHGGPSEGGSHASSRRIYGDMGRPSLSVPTGLRPALLYLR